MPEAIATPASARVWLLAAVNTRGRFVAPARAGHAAELEDGGRPVDSIVLMAVIQRHFLPRAQPAWDDGALARDLGLDIDDPARTQRVLDTVLDLRSRRADELILRRYDRLLTNQEIADAVRRAPVLRLGRASHQRRRPTHAP